MKTNRIQGTLDLAVSHDILAHLLTQREKMQMGVQATRTEKWRQLRPGGFSPRIERTVSMISKHSFCRKPIEKVTRYGASFSNEVAE